MISNILEIQEKFNNLEISATHNKMNDVIQKYTILYISQKIDIRNNIQAFERIKKSNIVIIDQYTEPGQKTEEFYFMITFKDTILFIEPFNLKLLHPLFSYKPDLTICFISNIKDIFDDSMKIEYKLERIDSKFQDDFFNFQKKFRLKSDYKPVQKYFPIISKSIISFLLQDSYQKIKKDRIKNYSLTNQSNPKQINDDEYITLRFIESGSSFQVFLIYHIQKEKLYVMKKLYSVYNEKSPLIQREVSNYSAINHPLLPKFYGRSYPENNIIIEFINGKTLSNIGKILLNERDKITIIFQLMVIIEFLHRNHFIYRDLKPNNVMIDDNKNIVLIDLDRMLKEEEVLSDKSRTLDFFSDFTAPEVNLGLFSYECDIFSLGKMMHYIITSGNENIDYSENYKDIKYMVDNCTKKYPKERPSITELILEFYILYNDQIKKSNFDEIYSKYFANIYNIKSLDYIKKIKLPTDIAWKKYLLGFFYNRGEIVPIDINKSIHYFTLAAELNHAESLFELGLIFFEEEYIEYDINKTIDYFVLASDLSHANARYSLGIIFSSNKFVDQDIDLSIHYFQLAADQGHCKSLYELGDIFYEGRLIVRDIEKAINYFILASDRNYVKAQCKLGNIYLTGEFVDRDIDISINYFELAAKQNNVEALFMLGTIYSNKNESIFDINKSIHYFQLAADQGHIPSYYNVSIMKMNKQLFEPLNNAINCLQWSVPFINDLLKTADSILSSCDDDSDEDINRFQIPENQNDLKSIVELGINYYKGKNVERNINKAIHYFQLAADKNNVESIYTLGMIFFDEKFVDRKINKAIKYFRLASDQGHIRAQYMLGNIYLENKFVNMDINKAEYYLQLAANQGHVTSMLQIASINLNEKYGKNDSKKAIHYLEMAANLNDMTAQRILGDLYYRGDLIKVDIDKSIEYFQLAANQGDLLSLTNLGKIYYHGKFIKADIKKSIHYFQLAAEQNDIESLYTLGTIFSDGRFIKVDINKAIHYFQLAADQNHFESMYELSIIYAEGKYINREIDKAIKYLHILSENNYTKAQYLLGQIYYNEKYIAKDINKAIHYFQLAAEKNERKSQYELGIIYHNEQSVFDINKSLYFLQLSANQNYGIAQVFLGIIFFYGDKVKRDLPKAMKYFRDAANQNVSMAQALLGYIYLFILDDKDKSEEYVDIGLKYLKLAEQQNDQLSHELLSIIYLTGKSTKPDIKKAKYYLRNSLNFISNNHFLNFYINLSENNKNEAVKFLQIASDQKDTYAQILLGYYTLYGIGMKQNIPKGIKLLEDASFPKFSYINFIIGYFYHEGRGVDQDINKAIHYYKESSTFNHPYAKNNLGVIYKNGFSTSIPQNLNKAYEYFNENMKYNNPVSMYNLAHLYIYQTHNQDNINKAIDLLIQSLNNRFSPSQNLLCIAAILQFGFDLEDIKKGINTSYQNVNDLSDKICQLITNKNLLDYSIFEEQFNDMMYKDYLYGDNINPFTQDTFEYLAKNNRIRKIYSVCTIPEISSEFYEGFGLDLLE